MYAKYCSKLSSGIKTFFNQSYSENIKYIEHGKRFKTKLFILYFIFSFLNLIEINSIFFYVL